MALHELAIGKVLMLRVAIEFESWHEYRDTLSMQRLVSEQLIMFYGAQSVGGVEAQSLFVHQSDCACLPCHDRLMIEANT